MIIFHLSFDIFHLAICQQTELNQVEAIVAGKDSLAMANEKCRMTNGKQITFLTALATSQNSSSSSSSS